MSFLQLRHIFEYFICIKLITFQYTNKILYLLKAIGLIIFSYSNTLRYS